MADVLVVDDHLDPCRMMAQLVSRCGHPAECVTSGEAALDFLSARPVALMILDVMMPGMDGMEVLRRVRSDPRFSGMKVVMWSAIGDPQFIAQAKVKGADDYWVKTGFSYRDVAGMLERVLGEARGGGGEGAGGR